MTGPEHYEISENALELARKRLEETGQATSFVTALLQIAAVHAQLATAAATIDAMNVREDHVTKIEQAWREVLK